MRLVERIALHEDNAPMTSEIGTIILAKLKELRRNRSWLAEQVGVSDTSVYNWIHDGKISRENAVNVALTLGISVNELLGQEVLTDGKAAAGNVVNEIYLDRVTATEMRLLTQFRQASTIGQQIILAAAAHAPQVPAAPEIPEKKAS